MNISEMPAKIPDAISNSVILKWLQGCPRDKIAKECGISGATVSGIVSNWKQRIGIDIANQLRDLAVSLEKFNIAPSQCADGFRTHLVLSQLGVDDNDIEKFVRKIYSQSNLTSFGPQKIADFLYDLFSFSQTARGHGNEKAKEGAAEDTEVESSTPVVPFFSQIPAYIERKKVENNLLEQENTQLRSINDSLYNEKSMLEKSIEDILIKKKITKENLDWYCSAKAELEKDGIPMDGIGGLRDAVRWTHDRGEDLPEIIRTFANYRALKVEKRSLENQISNLMKVSKSVVASNTELQARLEDNKLTLFIINELRTLGFGYKELKRLSHMLQEISRANGVRVEDGLAVEKFFSEVEEGYDDLLGFKATKEKLRKELKQLAMNLRTERNVFEAVPYANTALSSLLRKGVREDHIVEFAEIIENHPNFFDSYLKSDVPDIKVERPYIRASTSSLMTASSTVYTERSANVVDKADSNTHFDNADKTRPTPTQMGTAQVETNKENSIEEGLMHNSLNAVGTTEEEAPSRNNRIAITKPLARHVTAVKRYHELSIAAVTSSRSIPGHLPSSVLDMNSSDSWIGKGFDSWIQLDLGSKKNIHSINIAWSRRNNGPINFAVSVSEDGVSFVEMKNGSSDQVYPTLTRYALPTNTSGRYVRIISKRTSGDDRFGISGISILDFY